jgi:hypothetical protein
MSSTSIYSPQLKLSRYVQLAQLLRTRGWSTPHGWTIRRTSSSYKNRLKPISTVRKSQTRAVCPLGLDGPGPVNLENQSTAS